MKKFADSRVAVFGIGGVGGYVMEALARTGIGALDLIDNDVVSISNLNRQIIATTSTIGRSKVEVAAERIADIAPDCKVRAYQMFFLPDTQDQFDFTQYDYVVDAIDTVAGKLAIIEKAKAAGVPVISSMGAGNKIHPDMFEVADIYETSVCPLAKVIRQECRKRGIDSLKVVYSKEKPIRPAAEELSKTQAERAAQQNDRDGQKEWQPETVFRRRSTPGSTAFAPSRVGLIIASEVINDLANL